MTFSFLISTNFQFLSTNQVLTLLEAGRVATLIDMVLQGWNQESWSSSEHWKVQWWGESGGRCLTGICISLIAGGLRILMLFTPLYSIFFEAEILHLEIYLRKLSQMHTRVYTKMFINTLLMLPRCQLNSLCILRFKKILTQPPSFVGLYISI